MNNTEIPAVPTKMINKVSYTFIGEKLERAVNRKSKLTRRTSTDTVIVEQPLQISLSWLEQGLINSKVFTITMRTPGHDYLLIIGLLHSEGVIKQLTNIESITLSSADVTGEGKQNEWLVNFIEGFIPDLSLIDKYMMSYSSCGLCGTTSLKKLQLKTEINLSYAAHKGALAVQSLLLLSSKMRSEQGLFEQTGGVHGVALFDQQLILQHLYEDIGRHNAVDKVIGALLCKNASKNILEQLSVSELCTIAPLRILLVSGRISFEIVQKTIMAGISVLVGVGAPSDLAIQAAQQFDLTLIGFVSDTGFNVYHGDWRLSDS